MGLLGVRVYCTSSLYSDIKTKSRGGVLISKESLLQEVAKRLKQAREDAKLTVAAVEENTDLSKGNISSWENAKFFPGSWALVQLSELYGVSIDWILKGTVAKSNEQPQTQKVEAIFDPDLKDMMDVLKALMESGDADLRGWAKIQFKNAFKEHCATLDQKKLHA